MSRRRKARLPDWRNYLTPVETVECSALESNAAILDRRRKALTNQITKLRSRCIQRRLAALVEKHLEAAE